MRAESSRPEDELEYSAFERQTVSFVVRLWQEPHRQARSHWRGQVESVESGEVNHFDTASGLMAALARWAPSFVDEPPPGEEEQG